MSRNNRTLRRSLMGIGIALGVLVVSAVGFFLFLLTPPGENLLRRVALDRINDTIAGEADLRNLKFTGGTLELQGLVLRTSEGEEVVQVERVFVDLAFAPLLSGEVHLDRFEISDYSVRLRQQEDGRWNLAAALEREEPTEDEDPEEEDPVPFVVDTFELRGGTIDVRAETAGELRQLRIENIGATGFLALREQVSGTVDLRAYTTAPAEAPMVLHAQSRIEGETQHVEIVAWMGEAVIESRVQLPTSDAEDFDLGDLDGWLRVEAPAFSLADFTYGPAHVAAHVSDGRLVVPTAHAELPGSTLSSTMHEGDAAVRVTLSIDDLETTVRAVGALLPLELPEVSGQGEVQLHLENPIDVPNLGVVVRMGHVGVGETDLGNLRLEAASQQLEVSLAASLDEPSRAALRVEGAFTDARRETLRLDHIAVAYPETRWTNPAPALVHTDSGLRIEALSLVSDDQRIQAEVQWTDTARVARVQLSNLRLSSLPKALHPPALSFGGMLDGELDLRQPEDEPEASLDLRLTRGRLADVSGISARLHAEYVDERLRGALTSSLLSGTANAEFDLPAVFPPAEGAALDGRLDIDGIMIEEAWRAARDFVPDSTAERLERAAGRFGLGVALDGTWPDPNLRGRLTIEDGSLTLTELGRIRGIELLLEGDEDHVHLRTLRASTEEGSLTASGEARRVGDEPRYRYRLNVSADQFPVSLEDPVSATLEARIAGEITPDEVTSEVQADDIRVLRPEPPPPSPDDDEEE